MLRPLLFTLYVSPVTTVINSFEVSQMQYADDTQLYVALKDTKSTSSLQNCFRAVQH